MYFENLHQLTQHISWLQNILWNKDIFVVGWAVRDVLLGITKDPTDIDITLATDPKIVRQSIEKNNTDMSIFKTEKYGTMTLIDKQKEKNYEYEITPFRTEWSYTDIRHPDDITRSDDILADSQRRDFTINCLYRYSAELPSNIVWTPVAPNNKLKNHNELLKSLLVKYPNLYLTDSQTLILQDHESIADLFPKGKFQINQLKDIMTKAYKLTDGPSMKKVDSSRQSKDLSRGLSTKVSIIIDPHGGLQDILQNTIRSVGDPNKRFTEDALRILRWIRFPNILNQYLPERHKQNSGFTYNKTTRVSMLEHAHLVKNLAKERLHQELIKVFSGNNPFGYIVLLDELWLIETLFPALAKCKENIQPTIYHPFDTYTHTLLTLHALQQLQPDNHLAFFAMLYHDVGKPEQYAYIQKQLTKNPDEIDMSEYVHHTETGCDIAKKDFNKLGFSKKEIEEIIWYIRQHHRAGEILESKEKNRTKKLRQLLSEWGLARTLNLIDITIADRLGQYNPLQSPAIEELYEMKEHIKQLHDNEGRFTLQELAINGDVIMKEMDISAWPELGKLINQAFNRVLGDLKMRNTKKQILKHLKSLELWEKK